MRNIKIYIDKVWLQTWLEPKITTLAKKINMTIYFENLTIRLHILYVLNIHQISRQSDIINYLIHKLIFYAKFKTTKT